MNTTNSKYSTYSIGKIDFYCFDENTKTVIVVNTPGRLKREFRFKNYLMPDDIFSLDLLRPEIDKYEATLRATILPKDEWKKQFKNNIYHSRYSFTDACINSLTDILLLNPSRTEVTTMIDTDPALLMSRVNKRWNHYLNKKTPSPSYLAIALWLNFCPEHEIGLGSYLNFDPFLYSYQKLPIISDEQVGG